MYQLRAYVETIEQLLADGSTASLTYAALECRLAIELICYERLRNAHDYISHEDIRKWQPRELVNQLINEVDYKLATTLTLSVSRDAPEPIDAESYEKLEWRPLGSQIGFDPRKIGSLWNALSNVALHLKLPKSKDDFLSRYGDREKIREKVSEALGEIRRISDGDLIMSGMGEVVSFECKCGTKNRRRAGLLREGKIINCMNPACEESYECEIRSDEILFGRRTITVPCKCEDGMEVPKRSAEKMKTAEYMLATCERCGEKSLIQWRLMQAKLLIDE